MAAPKSYFPRAHDRFLPTDREITNNSMIFELDESEVWNSDGRSQSPDFRKQSSRVSRKPAAAAAARGSATGPASLPVNIPDWSKILKHEYRDNRRRDSDDDDFDFDEDEAAENGGRVPPHEFLARTRIASSVQEGIGRTLKGRDLNRVRNAIWLKVGFQD
ncbi:protein S40-4 [Salvia miltiorrhiza]|uniref:protein S40-4 n=1 Tax=Salvia miltiorrhiza TaxID=226208 RepID=UPI0025AD8822|nr:protein S40-4 [Salvia miltiorrhiza]